MNNEQLSAFPFALQPSHGQPPGLFGVAPTLEDAPCYEDARLVFDAFVTCWVSVPWRLAMGAMK